MRGNGTQPVSLEVTQWEIQRIFHCHVWSYTKEVCDVGPKVWSFTSWFSCFFSSAFLSFWHWEIPFLTVASSLPSFCKNTRPWTIPQCHSHHHGPWLLWILKHKKLYQTCGFTGIALFLWLRFNRFQHGSRNRTSRTKTQTATSTVLCLALWLGNGCVFSLKYGKIWGFPWPWGYPNSWMVYSGKSHEIGWFRGTPHFRKCPIWQDMAIKALTDLTLRHLQFFQSPISELERLALLLPSWSHLSKPPEFTLFAVWSRSSLASKDRFETARICKPGRSIIPALAHHSGDHSVPHWHKWPKSMARIM